MKRIISLLILVAGYHMAADAQSHFRAGLGYYGENMVHPGLVLELEHEPFFTERFSLPLRADFGFHTNPDYKAWTMDLHKGFRKYFRSGLFLEQSVGVGVIAKGYRTDYWYMDDYYNPIPHGNTTVWGFMPSVTAGAGYKLSGKKEGGDLLWVRPKVYWDLGFRGFHLPYFALQIGYSHTFKTK